MYVCICRAVSARAIHQAVEAGATSVDEVSWATGASTQCGTCRDHVAEQIEVCLRRGDGSPVLMPAPG